MDYLQELATSDNLVRLLASLIVFACAIMMNAAAKVVFRFLTRRAVRRALRGEGNWRLRLPRIDDGNSGEQRRVQRADAAAHMFSRLFALFLAIGVTIVVSHIVDVNPLVLISSAGFVGAGVAIGGQAVIKDWLTGLLVLIEDRYAVGDRIVAHQNGETYEGLVEALNSTGLRLRCDDGSTWYAGHGSIDSVTNFSQQLIASQIIVPTNVWAELDETMVGQTIQSASHELGLTDVLLVADIEAMAESDGETTVEVKASRRLNDRQRRLLRDRIIDQGHTSQDET